MSARNAFDESMTARPEGSERGTDIVFVPADRHYYLTRIDGGKAVKIYQMHESRVEYAERW